MQRGLRVVVVDHAPAPGRKILISGGGRANFTNLNTRPEHFLSENPHFSKSALARYVPRQFVALVERHGIAYHEKAPGQLFCDGPARQIVDMLLAECQGAEMRLGAEIRSVAQEDGFRLHLQSPGGATTLTSRKLVVATGGLSIPKLGATGFGYELAKQFGLEVVPPRPALVPLTFASDERNPFAGLSGVAGDCEIALAAKPGKPSGRQQPARFRDKLLVTHRGLSGPAVLQISSYWRHGAALAVDFAPGRNVLAPLIAQTAGRGEAMYLAALGEAMPKRLAERLLQLAAPERWSNDALLAAEARLHAWPLAPDGTEGYAKAEVTAGGVATGSLHAHSLEARAMPGLHCIGEVVDVTGHLGGFNFQWAWASAAAAAEAIAGENP